MQQNGFEHNRVVHTLVILSQQINRRESGDQHPLTLSRRPGIGYLELTSTSIGLHEDR
jgi:hypothetical protein